MLSQHNAWANDRVLAAALEAPTLEADPASRAPNDTVISRLQHFAGTEEAFVHALSGTPKRPDPPSELSDLRLFLAKQDAALSALCEELDQNGLSESRHIPWFRRDVPVQDCLAQVFNHSAQHRSEIALDMARAGADTGSLDYIVWRLAL